MSRRSSNAWEDLSFPEIPTELWFQDEPKGPVQSVDKTESTSQIDTDALEKDDFVEIHLDTLEENSDSALWEEFPDIQTEDLWEVDSETRGQNPEPSEKVSLSPPLYHLLGKRFDEAASSDIEEGGMSVFSAGNLVRKYKHSGGLSVTDLLQPLWCEYKTYYNLVGLERQGVERRLKEFEVTRKVLVDDKVVEKRAVIKVDQAAVHQGERHKVRGQKIHEKLESEVAPVQIRIRPKTREEVWGLRLLNMITGLVALKNNQIWRELPVFGFIQNIPVNGIIDNLVLGASPGPEIGNILRISDFKSKLATSRLDRDPPKEHKVQLMVYKQLLDGLLAPNYDWTYLFKSHHLDYLETFSDAFIARSIDMAQSNQLGTEAEEARTLDDLTKVWDRSVQDLNLLRGAVEPELSVEYRQAVSLPAVLNVVFEMIPSPDPGESTIVGRQTFEYDEDFVQQTVSQVLEFWLGTRQHIGVDINETWKCNVCEYKADCEWRKEQASVYSQKTTSKR